MSNANHYPVRTGSAFLVCSIHYARIHGGTLYVRVSRETFFILWIHEGILFLCSSFKGNPLYFVDSRGNPLLCKYVQVSRETLFILWIHEGTLFYVNMFKFPEKPSLFCGFTREPSFMSEFLFCGGDPPFMFEFSEKLYFVDSRSNPFFLFILSVWMPFGTLGSFFFFFFNGWTWCGLWRQA
jgi:hypothetical protein